jgi:hypothetical protein
LRKSLTVSISAEGRDKGKAFQLTEMPASKAEKWAIRTVLALGKAGIDIPEDMASQGMSAIAALGIRALTNLKFEDAEPLLAEMFECVQCIPDASRPDVRRALIEDDIEEVATRLSLRKDILSLHIDFFTAVAPSN